MERALSTRVGVVGLGQMGMAVCRRLVDRGLTVCATDLRTELRDDLRRTGARWESTASIVAKHADVLITMLPGASTVSEICHELAGALAPGATWLEMSTASPQAAADVAAVALARGVRVLDAPVAGGPDDARAGCLLVLVGGAPADVDAVRPILDLIADRVVHVGAHGSGYVVKLLTNSLWFGQAVAVAEVLTLARRAGIDLEVLREAVGQSAAASHFMAVDADALLDGDDLASFSLARCCEQLSTVLGLGAELGVPLSFATLVADVHRRALVRYGDVNGELLGARLIAEEAGVELRRS